MTDLERKLVFKIAQGDEKNFPLIHSLRNTSKDYFNILQYCVKNDLTGKKFTQLFADHKGSTVRVISTLLKKMEKNQNREVNILDLR